MLTTLNKKTMKKSIFLFALLVNNIYSFGQELPFKKADLSNAVALEKQMQQLAALCDTQNLSELDLFKFQLIKENDTDALSTIKKRIKDTPKEERVYLDLYLQYVEAKLAKNFIKTFKNSYKNYLIKSDDIFVINLDKTLILRDGTDYFISNFKNIYNNIKSNKISNATAQNLIKKLGMKDSADLDAGIAIVMETYGKSDRNKYRAVVYYMLTKHFKKEAVYS